MTDEPKMPRFFLSASVPLPSRNRVYFESADVLAIRDAVRALAIVVLELRAQLVFGGHPAISPMVRFQVAQTGRPVGEHIVMFQSRYFERDFPTNNQAFERVELVDGISGDRDASLLKMREHMLNGEFAAALFIGGMEGVEEEYELFKRMHPHRPRYPIASTGAAAWRLFQNDAQLQAERPELQDEISYLSLMRGLIAV